MQVEKAEREAKGTSMEMQTTLDIRAALGESVKSGRVAYDRSIGEVYYAAANIAYLH
jgi:hypothetical protein